MTEQLKKNSIETYWKDFAVSLLIMILSGPLIFQLYGMHESSLITTGKNVYFQGDLPRIYESMTDRMSEGHYRLKVHPLTSLYTFPPTLLLKKLGMDSYEAVKTVVALIGAMWGLCLYIMIRLIGVPRLISLLITALGLSSAAAIFWLSVPESYGLGSISIILALSLAALANKKILSSWFYIIISSITLSTTITNWMSGIFATFANKSFKQTIDITLISLSIVTIFWGLQKRFFPAAVFFIGDTEESNYIFFPDTERIISVTNSFLLHTVMAPSVKVLGENGDGWPIVSFQNSLLVTSNIINLLGIAIWIVIISIGIWALFCKKEYYAFRLTLGLTLSAQLLLHLVYGEETFLYSLHFLPLLLALVALGTLTKLRKLVVFFVILLVPILMINNWDKFQQVNTIAVSPN